MTDLPALIARLRALSRCEHDDLSIGDDAADALAEARDKALEEAANVAEGHTEFIPGLTSHHENNIRCYEGDEIAAAIRALKKGKADDPR